MPWKNIFKVTAVAAAVWFLIVGKVAPSGTTTFADSSNTTTDAATERAQLEAQLAQLEDQINQYQGQITSYQKQGKSLSTEVSKLNAQIAQLNLQIKSVDLTLTQLGGQINATQSKIGDLQGNINQNQVVLGSLLQQLYENESASMVEVLLENPKLSDFFNDLNNYSLLQSGVHDTIDQITNLRDQLVDQKTQLAQAKSDAETIKSFRVTQANQVSATKQQENQLLTQTKGQESKYQALLSQSQASAAKIRNRLFELMGGGQLTFEQAYQYAKIAGTATGVRPAFLLAILDRESALGQNVGQCSYQTAMNPKEQPIFLKITSALGIDPGTVKVSCPNADGVYGGAMGPAQFLPSTWQGYVNGVMKITGKSSASPWSNGDAFIAAALYLKDAGAVTDEKTAAAKYYCGSNYNRLSVCKNVYGQNVVNKATQFQDDIDTIGG